MTSAAAHVRTLVERYQLRAQKRLGQNFLINDHVLDRIADLAALENPSGFIEIGPGPGTLTRRIAQRGRPMAAIEKDQAWSEVLKQELADFDNLSIVDGDALKVDLPRCLPDATRPAVIGNIPYNISSPLLVRLIEQRANLGPVTLLMQREVVDRLLAGPGSKTYGRLSILLRLYAEAQKGPTVGPGNFWPPPKVQSAVIHWTWRIEPAVQTTSWPTFHRVVKASFGQRRKTLRNALKSSFHPDQIAACEDDFDLRKRAEQLDLDEFAQLANVLSAQVTKTLS
ncbi:MAG: 16S rRNA (adenine(1518)-N(6)/adenine(1519)-N(6))-dimethyltransferase RsmA, partial [Myxococcota bacterium]